MNVKNVTVFGGTGETGLMVVKYALAKGYGVTAYARSPSKITFEHHNLDVVRGELDDYDSIKRAVQATNTVISVLRPKPNSKEPMVAQGTKNIVSAMVETRVKRLIATATPTLKVNGDKFQLGFAFGDFIMKHFYKNNYRDMMEAGKAITQSDLDWTMVRLPMLNNKPATGNLNVGYTGDGNVNFFSLSKEDLANFLVQQVEDRTYVQKAPIISN